MKFPGTLKVEIIKPLNCSWDEAGARMRALSRSCGEALTETQRDLWPELAASLQLVREGKSEHATELKRKAFAKAPKLLTRHWNEALQRYVSRTKLKEGIQPELISRPVTEYLVAETAKQLMAAWNGEHFKGMLALRKSVPSWHGDEPFYSRSRNCEVSGRPHMAKLTFPLWKGGSGATELAVAVEGGSDRATWNRLVADADKRRRLMDLEAASKPISKAKRETLSKKQLAELETSRKLALDELASIDCYKMGRVSIARDDRRGKWYANISWVRTKRDEQSDGQAASVHFGVNNFMHVYAEDGSDYYDRGADILAHRLREWHKRQGIQKAMPYRGTGSRNRGKNNRYRALTRKNEAEHKWTQNRLRQSAARLVKWCIANNVSVLVMQDMTGYRDKFEKKTGGDGHAEVKLYIHSWPWRATQDAIERECRESGVVQVRYVKNEHKRTRCPECENESEGNAYMRDVSGQFPPLLKPNPLGGEPILYRASIKTQWFECTKCGTRASGDIITCANLLLTAGHGHSLEKRQGERKKRVAEIRESLSDAQSKMLQTKRTARKPARRGAKRKAS